MGHRLVWAAVIAFVLILQIGSLGSLIGSSFLPEAAAITEVVFQDNFDSGLSGWIQSLCIIYDASQTCEIETLTALGFIPPPSPPNWGSVLVRDIGGGSCSPEVRVKYAKTFNVVSEADYDLSTMIATVSCDVCRIHAQLFLDTKLIFDIPGKQRNIDPPPFTVSSFHQTTVHLLPGMHTIEMGMRSPFGACAGGFRGTFDDIMIQRDIPNSPPVAIAQDVTVSADDNCQASASVNNGSFDPDGDPVTISQSPAGPYSLGATSVTLTVEDDKGASDTAAATVTVIDDTPPMVTAPPDIMVIANTAGGYSGSIGAATASDNCDSSPAINSDAPSVFPLGDTTVTWTATDGSGNSASADQVVTVKPLPIQIDIKPECLNIDSHGVIPVDIFGSATLDVNNIDPGSVMLDGLAVKATGKSDKLLAHIEDVNGDGFNDLVVQIQDVDNAFSPGTTMATLTGTLFNGIPFEGIDSICITQ